MMSASFNDDDDNDEDTDDSDNDDNNDDSDDDDKCFFYLRAQSLIWYVKSCQLFETNHLFFI